MKITGWRTIQNNPAPAFGRCSQVKIRSLVKAKLLTLRRTAAGLPIVDSTDLDRVARRFEEGVQAASGHGLHAGSRGRISAGLTLAGLALVRPRCAVARRANAEARAAQFSLQF